MCRGRSAGVEVTGDLGEALAGGALGTDALDNLWRHRGRTAGRCWGAFGVRAARRRSATSRSSSSAGIRRAPHGISTVST